MSTLLDAGFNFTPTGLISQSTTYTVPTGSYALVTLFFTKPEASTTIANISINGSVVLSNRTYFLYDLTFNIPNFTCNVYGFFGTGIAESNYPWSGSTAFNYSGIASATNLNTGQGVINYQMPTKITVWLKAGDVVTGTGAWKIIGNTFSANTSTTGFKPFNYNPSQTVVASSSYTIPAGKYAIVTHYFMYQSYSSIACPDYGSRVTLTLNGNILKYVNNKTPYVYHTYVDDKSSTTITEDYRNKNDYVADVRPVVYEAKAGDVINGSGNWRAVISIYDNIS